MERRSMPTPHLHRKRERRAIDRTQTSGSRMVDCLRHAARSYEIDLGHRSAILAGFPWFDVWTRDTFTAFTGVYLATGRFAEGRKTLATFAPLVVHGMLPANLPNAVTKPRFNAADASFWFIVCVGRYVRMTNDASILNECAWKAVREIIERHCDGKPPHIRVDTDGLVHAAAPDQALAWMNADYQGHVMTPRRGKPVEIQALWIHALDTAIELADRMDDLDFAKRFVRSPRPLLMRAFGTTKPAFSMTSSMAPTVTMRHSAMSIHGAEYVSRRTPKCVTQDRGGLDTNSQAIDIGFFSRRHL